MVGPSVPTIKRLFAVSGNTCAFPRCRKPLYDNGILIADICHIKGDKPTAARFDPKQTDAERHGFNNFILLCKNHHAVIDNDDVTYSVDRLQSMKREHESAQTIRFAISDGEAMRLSIFAGGTVIGAVATTLANSLGEVVKAVAEIAPTKEKKQETLTIPKLLNRIGPGEIAFASEVPALRQLGTEIVGLFGKERWKIRDATDQLQAVGSMPARALVLLYVHHNDAAAHVIAIILDVVFEAIGIARMNEDQAEWRSKDGLFRVILAPLRR